MNSHLNELDLNTIIDLIQNKEVSPVEIVEGYLHRIDEHDKTMNAWVSVHYDSALTEAKKAEKNIMENKGRGVLEGVPFSAKDNIFTKGMETTAGSKSLAGFYPNEDAEVVTQLKQNGAILIGKNRTTELAISNRTDTKNPHNTAYSPGGSSSGSAAAVAASMVPFSLGTQTGGSLIRPASYCGVVTLKTAPNRMSRNGIVSLSESFDCVGTLTRNMKDQSILFDILKVPHTEEKTINLDSPAEIDDLKDLTIGIPESFFFEDLEQDVSSTITTYLDFLEQQGANLVVQKLHSNYEELTDAHIKIVEYESSRYLIEELDLDLAEMGDIARSSLEKGLKISDETYAEALRVKRFVQNEVKKPFETVDIFLTPTSPTLPPEGDFTGSPKFCVPFVINSLPTITIPCGRAGSNLPVGIQIAGKPLAEIELLRKSYLLENAVSLGDFYNF